MTDLTAWFGEELVRPGLAWGSVTAFLSLFPIIWDSWGIFRVIFFKINICGKVWAGGCGGNCAACGVTSVPGVKR